MNRLWLLLVLTCMLAPAHLLQAQQTMDEAGELRVFLDCDACDSQFLRTEIPWVAFMRERRDADVHILVTTITTGSGGREYTINLVGLRDSLRSDTLRFVAQPNMADDAVRTGLTRMIELGLVAYALETPQASGLSVEYRRPDAATGATVNAHDPWNAWVFQIGGDAEFDKEQLQSETEVFGSLSANRITDQWKIGVSANGEINRNHVEFERDGEMQSRTTRRDGFGSGIVAIRSLGPHWGAGAQASASSSTFQNIKLALRAAPAIEFSVWPYAEATRRQLTLQYSVGVSSYRYLELTIFDRLEETRPTQSFIVGYDVRQPWGEADVTLETSAFLDDLEQFRLEFDSGVDVRLFRGFSLSLGASAGWLRDQIAIVKDPDPDDVLQELRELQTNFRYEVRVGFNYAFGSIFNSVVNPRFGGGVGQILR